MKNCKRILTVFKLIRKMMEITKLIFRKIGIVQLSILIVLISSCGISQNYREQGAGKNWVVESNSVSNEGKNRENAINNSETLISLNAIANYGSKDSTSISSISAYSPLESEKSDFSPKDIWLNNTNSNSKSNASKKWSNKQEISPLVIRPVVQLMKSKKLEKLKPVDKKEIITNLKSNYYNQSADGTVFGIIGFALSILALSGLIGSSFLLVLLAFPGLIFSIIGLVRADGGTSAMVFSLLGLIINGVIIFLIVLLLVYLSMYF